ncbi:barstar family protein [Aliikangiella sp. IMCC44359]|uniref:barstar family protein n=1 Tax=Aliikangiella sp. IMCC44359 TaxID=3459125 RepID=UPI00403B2907
MYLLYIGSERDEPVGAFCAAEGLEENTKNLEHREVKLLGGVLHEKSNIKKTIGYCDVLICVCDLEGNIIANLDGVAGEVCFFYNLNLLEVILRGNGLPSVLPGSISIWNERRKYFPLKYGEWIGLSPSDKAAWLQVTLFDLRRKRTLIQNTKVEIDGESVDSLTSFLCAFGEAVFGPGGYMGRDLGGLDDCLSCNLGVKTPLKLFWKNSKFSKDGFIRNGENDVYEKLLILLKELNVEIIPS